MYLDVLWLLNFAVDLLLLICANRLSGYPGSARRLLPAAILGGIYGCVCVLPGFAFLAGTLWRLVFLGLMGGIAYGFSRAALRRCVLFVLLTMALGGIALGMGRGGILRVLLSAFWVCLMCFFGLRGRIGKRFVPVEVQREGSCHRFTAMVDTGNTLTDPVTGQQVLVVSSGLGQQLLGCRQWDFSDPVSSMEHIPGGRLIPYQGVGVKGGLLAAKRFPDVKIGKWHGGCLTAFAPYEIGN